MSVSKTNPFEREEHRYVNKMAALIVRCRLVIKQATAVIDDLEIETDEHIDSFMKRRRAEDNKKSKEI